VPKIMQLGLCDLKM